MKIIFLGKPGSGKGLLSQFLKDDIKIEKISTGDILRGEIKKKTKLGLEVEKKIIKGEYIDDNRIINLIKKAVKNKKNYILDGFPRTLRQAKLFKEKIDKVIYIKCSDKVVIDRLSGRVQCRKCNRIYHLKNVKPKKKGICDLCGGKLYVRKDETKKGIKERLKHYKKETMPLIKYYKKKGLLIEINGDRHYKVILREIKSYIKK